MLEILKTFLSMRESMLMFLHNSVLSLKCLFEKICIYGQRSQLLQQSPPKEGRESFLDLTYFRICVTPAASVLFFQPPPSRRRKKFWGLW